jgi:hypothetical protein
MYGHDQLLSARITGTVYVSRFWRARVCLQVEDFLHGKQRVGGVTRNKTVDVLQKLKCNQLERSRAQPTQRRVLLASIEA